jgi:hypothetical protein
VARYAAVGLLAAGCGGGSPAAPAPEATSSACAALLTRLPARVLDQPANGSAGGRVVGEATWGDPAIVLRCGVPPPGPTSQRCQAVDGIDWVIAEEPSEDGVVFTTYGRRPAVEVGVPSAYDPATASAALVDLAPAVRPLPSDRTCLA